MRPLLFPLSVVALLGCAHYPLSGSDLDRAVQPAFISRIEEGAGPKSLVFREDGAYSAKLKKLEPKEADRRLQNKLSKGMTRFEISEGLRSKVLSQLPQDRPWLSTVDPVAVARALESFLVEEVPANPPDYNLLVPLGADTVVEFVIEDYGMRSSGGRAGTYIEGYGRMFFIDGQREIWRRAFRADQVSSKSQHVDPFRVAKDPAMFRAELSTLIDAVAERFAKDLNPPRRSESPPPTQQAERGEEKPKVETKKESQETELPEPDPL